jgi:hypothetical protein
MPAFFLPRFPSPLSSLMHGLTSWPCIDGKFPQKSDNAASGINIKVPGHSRGFLVCRGLRCMARETVAQKY